MGQRRSDLTTEPHDNNTTSKRKVDKDGQERESCVETACGAVVAGHAW